MNRKLWDSCIAAIVFMALISIVLVSESVGEGESVVVANRNVDGGDLSRKEVKNIFLGRKTKLAGVEVEIVTLEEGDVHDLFLKEMLRKSRYQFTNYWKRQVLTGKGQMPRSFASEGDLLSYLSRTENAVGYVGMAAFNDSDVPDGSVKIIGVQR